MCTLALANWRNPQTDDPQQPLLVFATDGSGAKGQAGYGATAIRTTGADLQTHTTTAYTRDRVVTEEAGRVVTIDASHERGPRHVAREPDTSARRK